MSSNLISIANSGVRAAKAGLDVTAQNISNASTSGYIRRSLSLAELVLYPTTKTGTSTSAAGVRLTGLNRNVDVFRQSEVRRTTSDASRANAEVAGLLNIENAVEQTGVFDSITRLEAALQELLSDPTDGSLRASALEQARAFAETMNTAASSLSAVGNALQFEAQAGVDSVNSINSELARVNLRLAQTANSTDQGGLLDRRDLLLGQLSGQVDISTSFDEKGVVQVRLGRNGGPLMVDGVTTSPLGMPSATNGTIGFTLAGSVVAISSGSLAGKSQALSELSNVNAKLNAVATSVIGAMNTAQAGGVDIDGNAGQPLFTGTSAADISIALSNGGKIATAPTGAVAGSRDTTNLDAIRNALANADPASAVDLLLLDISSAVETRSITRDTLETMAQSSRSALETQSGVDLDEEAVNLTRFQEAYQANARVMQVASDIFDAILAVN